VARRANIAWREMKDIGRASASWRRHAPSLRIVALSSNARADGIIGIGIEIFTLRALRLPLACALAASSAQRGMRAGIIKTRGTRQRLTGVTRSYRRIGVRLSRVPSSAAHHIGVSIVERAASTKRRTRRVNAHHLYTRCGYLCDARIARRRRASAGGIWRHGDGGDIRANQTGRQRRRGHHQRVLFSAAPALTQRRIGVSTSASASLCQARRASPYILRRALRGGDAASALRGSAARAAAARAHAS